MSFNEKDTNLKCEATKVRLQQVFAEDLVGALKFITKKWNFESISNPAENLTRSVYLLNLFPWGGGLSFSSDASLQP